MKVWVTRDKIKKVHCRTKVWREKPTFIGNRFYGGEIMSTSQWLFKRDFGFTPRKGSCKRYELTLKEI